MESHIREHQGNSGDSLEHRDGQVELGKVSSELMQRDNWMD